MSECERCDRLQEQIDDAREVLRKNGVTGFGALREGLEKITTEGMPFTMEIKDRHVRRLVKRVMESEDHLENREHRRLITFKAEICKMVVDRLAEHVGISAERVLNDVERAVMAILVSVKKQVEEEMAEEEERK